MRKNDGPPFFRMTTSCLMALFLLVLFAPPLGAAPAGAAPRGAMSHLPHLAVFRVANETGNASYEAACGAATSSLLLTVRQLGIYELLPVEGKDGARDFDSLRAWCETHNADYVLFGSISAGQGGRLVCGLSLFDRSRGRVSLEKDSGDVLPLEVFEAEDELIASMLDAMSGRHIGFGSIVFSNGGVKGNYRVLLDGTEAGRNIGSLDKILNGTHSVSVSQTRMFGEFELARKDFDLAEGESIEVGFEIPSLTPAEEEKLEGLEATARRDWTKAGAEEAVSAIVEEYAALARDSGYSPAIAEYGKRAKQLSAEWAVMRNRLEILDAAREPGSELLDASVAAYLTAKGYPQPEAIRAAARENALLLATILELKAAREAGEGDCEASARTMASILDFSRYLPAERTSEYTFAASSLRELADSSPEPEEGEAKLGKIFGERIGKAKSFYDGSGEAELEALASMEFAAFGRPVSGPAKGRSLLVVESEPANAPVSIDDGEPQSTPFSLELPPGAHSFSVPQKFIDGTYYLEEAKQWLTLPAGETVRLPLKLKPAMATLALDRVPAGYSVFMDEAFLCETPAGEIEVKAGSHPIRIEKPGRKTIYSSTLILPGQTENIPWGNTVNSAFILERRTIKLEAKPDSWAGIEPLYEGGPQSAFMGLANYGIKRVFLCRDDKYLYWRVDFNALNPLDKIPPKVDKRMIVELDLERTGGNANYAVSFLRASNGYDSWATLWDQRSRTGTDIDKQGSPVKWKLGKDILVASVPLDKVLPYIEQPVGVSLSLANFGEQGKGWKDTASTSRFFVDFGE